MNNINNVQFLYNLSLEHKLAHAYLIETNDVELCYKNVEKLCKKLFCENEYSDNCKNCNICNLIDKKSLSNFIVIEPDGKSIKKKQIDDLKSTCALIPLFVKKNIYVIKYAEKMNDTAYNKMLKFIEEPEENIIGFYITSNKSNIPSTIISRLEIIKDYYEKEPEDLLSTELKKEADIFISKLESKDVDILWYNETILSNLLKERTDLINFIRYVFNYYYTQSNKCMNYKKITQIISKYINQLNSNVNGTLLMNSMILEIGEL